MAETTNELMYELLKRVNAGLDAVKTEITDVKREVQAVRTHMIAMQQDTSNIYSVLGGHSERFEHRLNLVEPAQ